MDITRKEQFKEARTIDLQAYCQNILGLRQSHCTGKEVWFFSPFAPEQKTPSFKVNLSLNNWKDFALSNQKGGDLADLVATLNQCSLYEALDIILAKAIEKQSFSFRGLSNNQPEKPKPEKLNFKPLGNNLALSNYLESRKIPLSIASPYLQEIYYFIGQKHYFGLAMANDAKGYEVANKYGKNCIGAKDITSFDLGFTSYAIFEGMFDFLAFLTWLVNQDKALKTNVLILHSVSNTQKAIDFLKAQNCQKVFAFLDNDTKGKESLEIIKTSLLVTDCAYLYADYKDFNEYLINN